MVEIDELKLRMRDSQVCKPSILILFLESLGGQSHRKICPVSGLQLLRLIDFVLANC